MNAFDFTILSWLNQFVGHFPVIDRTLVTLSAVSGFLSAGPIVALYCWAWFKDGEKNDRNRKVREVVMSSMLSCVAALIACRLTAVIFPFRIRPIADPTNGFHFPKESFISWQHWSSFPSDHAIMFLTLTTGLFFISRNLGWIALLDSVFLVLLPRVYLGIHYPTDILAGAAIGVGIGVLANQKPIKRFMGAMAFPWLEKRPGLFYAITFLFMCQVANTFSDTVFVAAAIIHHLDKLF